MTPQLPDASARGGGGGGGGQQCGGELHLGISYSTCQQTKQQAADPHDQCPERDLEKSSLVSITI